MRRGSVTGGVRGGGGGCQRFREVCDWGEGGSVVKGERGY